MLEKLHFSFYMALFPSNISGLICSVQNVFPYRQGEDICWSKALGRRPHTMVECWFWSVRAGCSQSTVAKECSVAALQLSTSEHHTALLRFHLIHIWIFKAIVYPKMKIFLKVSSPSDHQRCRWVTSSDSEKCVSASVSQQWMLCSEWVPSEWESDKNITIIHK